MPIEPDVTLAAHRARCMLRKIRAHDDAMNAGTDPQSPTGDDYNDIFGWAMAALAALEGRS